MKSPRKICRWILLVVGAVIIGFALVVVFAMTVGGYEETKQVLEHEVWRAKYAWWDYLQRAAAGETLARARAGNEWSQLTIAELYYEQDRISDALDWFHRAAEQDNAEALNRLGSIYFFDLSVPKDCEAAVSYYNRAADQDHVQALQNLHHLYWTGDCVPKDIAQAAQYNLRAARLGNVHAQYRAGSDYEDGRGVPQDYVEAYKWYTIAVVQGHRNAIFARAFMRKHMTPEQITEAKLLAAEWRPDIEIH